MEPDAAAEFIDGIGSERRLNKHQTFTEVMATLPGAAPGTMRLDL